MSERLRAWCKACCDIATIRCLEDWSHSEQVEPWEQLDDKTMELFELIDGQREYKCDIHWYDTVDGQSIPMVRYK